jgi:molecular chaperone HtpG
MSNKQFKLHMAGLLEVLAGSLYANQQVGLRELIQNAHDSCTRRKIEERRSFFRPRIDILTDPDAKTLTILDNGSGLTESEIEDYLATIGRSYTGRLRDELSLFTPEDAVELIGQFGFGFLSAFMLASEVTVQTLSWQPDSQPLRWYCDGGETYTISPGDQEEVGTTVVLRLRPETGYLLDEEFLVEKIRQYADFLAIPIYLDQRNRPVNLMSSPWESAHPEQAVRDYIHRAYGEIEPLVIIPIQDHTVELNGDTAEILMSGFLFIPPASVASVREFGDLRVYIRAMFICDDEDELLPSWARFVRGVIDCPYLQPTASRESVRKDETFFEVQAALQQQLGRALQDIADNEPILWRKIVTGHADIMTGWAVRDDAFFNQVADILTFRTSQGQLTLPEYLALTSNKIYYVTHEINSLQEKILAEGNQSPVIEAVWFAVRPFLQKYAEREGLTLIALDGDPRQLLKTADEGPLIEIIAAYQRQGIRVQAADFAPVEVPALMIYPEDIEFRLESRRAKEQEEIPNEIMGLIDAYLEDTAGEEDLNGTLYLNAAAPLWQTFLDQELNGRQMEAVCQLIYQVARLFSGRALTAATGIDAFAALNQALTEMIRHD